MPPPQDRLFVYRRDVLTRLPSMTNAQVHEVAPAVWAKSKATTLNLAA